MSSALKLLRLFYFPDEFILYSDSFIRAAFSLYYLPFLGIVLASTHSILQNVTYGLVVPILKRLQLGSVDQDRFALYQELWFRLLPCAVLGAATTAIGYILLNCVVEAMIDSFSTYDGKDYPLLAARFAYQFESRSRRKVFWITLVLFSFFCWHLYYFLPLSRRSIQVVVAAWSIISAQTVFVVSGVLLTRPASNSSIVRHMLDVWWGQFIHRIRHFAIEMLLVFSLYWMISQGIIDMLHNFVEVLSYLNLPHLFGFTVLSFSVAVSQMGQNFRWLRRHKEYFWATLCTAMVYQSFILYALVLFRLDAIVLTLCVFISLRLWSRCILLVREFDVSPQLGRIHWKEAASTSSLSTHWAVRLEDSFERRRSGLGTVGLDLAVDMKKMEIYPRGAEPIKVVREVITKAVPSVGRILRWTLPRIFVFQSSWTMAGNRFRNARILLKVITGTILLLFFLLICLCILQTVVPSLKPLPIRFSTEIDEGASPKMTINQILAQVQVTLNRANEQGRENREAVPSVQHPSQIGDRYSGLCTRSFHNITVWEMAWFATFAYLRNEDDARRAISFFNNFTSPLGEDWQVVHTTDSPFRSLEEHCSGWNEYFAVRSPSRGLTVVAVRGTDLTTFMDMLQDVNLFFEAVLFHLMSSVVPGSSLLPSNLIADFLYTAAKVGDLGRDQSSWVRFQQLLSTLLGDPPTKTGESGAGDLSNRIDTEKSKGSPPPIHSCPPSSREYYIPILRFVEETRLTGETVLLTGHSMGGSVANIVGAQLGIRSIAFSSPGIVLSKKKFGVTLESINEHTLTVIPSHDIVPFIGWQAGELHHIICTSELRERCHAIESVVGTLWRACGSLRAKFANVKSVDEAL